MRIAVFSDVHANLEALQETLAFLEKEKIEKFFIVGDLIGYGANPNECIDLIRQLDCEIVAGNHDYGVLGKTDINLFNAMAKQAIQWTTQQMSKISLDYLANLQLVQKKENWCLVHATLESPASWQYVFDNTDALNQFAYFKEWICFIGHSHLPTIFELQEQNQSINEIRATNYRLKDNCRYLVNVGSIGQPRDGDNRACLVIWDRGKSELEYIRLEYNIKSAQEKIIKAGLPEFLALRLSLGK
ncbi:MAG: metallophosphoesterase family protein [candidate division WOR-3 bacterium]